MFGQRVLRNAVSVCDANYECNIFNQFDFSHVVIGPQGGREEETRVGANIFKIDSNFATSLGWSIQDGQGVVDVLLPGIADDLPMPKPPSTQVWLLKADGTSYAAISKPTGTAISSAGVTIPHLIYLFSPAAATSAVAVVIQLEEEFFVYPLTPHTSPVEKDGGGKPAIRTESD